MPRKQAKTPSYCRHKATGQAYVRLDGRTLYLGAHDSPASRAEYDRVLAEWLAHGRRLPRQNDLSVEEVISAYLDYAEAYYVPRDGTPDYELGHIRLACRPLRRLYADTLAVDFSPNRLRTVREAFIDAGNCRKFVNKQVKRIIRLFRWAVSRELVPANVLHALEAVESLRRGRCDARESKRVRPVAWAKVDAIRPHVSRQVWAMIALQRHTGMRPGEVVTMRGCDLNMEADVWTYTPGDHKNAWRDQPRIVELGPKAQTIVAEFLRPGYLFSPADADAERRDALHAKRKTPLKYGNRPGTNRRRRPKRKPGDHYDVDTYRRAIARGCALAFPPPEPLRRRDDETAAEYQARLTDDERTELKQWRKDHTWHPHQIRHAVATEIRKQYGIEVAQIVLGQKSMQATLIYAEEDRGIARRVAREVG